MQHTFRQTDGAGESIRRAAFTLTEIIAVIVIMVILLAVSIPAFTSTIKSSESSNVQTQLRLALLSGRDAALSFESGADSAVVFTYEPGGGTTILVCEHVGEIDDDDPNGGTVTRDVFVPHPDFEPVQLTGGWLVHGLAPAGTLGLSDDAWYQDYPRRVLSDRDDRRYWLFPETSFYDALVDDDGDNRQTFMVRFNGGFGDVAMGDTREALIVSPRPTATDRDGGFREEYRFDATPDLRRLVRQAINDDRFASGLNAGTSPLVELLGNQSGDTVLARTVDFLSLYKVSDFANAIGLKLNDETGVFYANDDEPSLDVPRGAGDFYDQLRLWIDGNTSAAADNDQNDRWIINDDADEPVARIYTVQRYTGQIMEVPLLDLEGATR